MRVEIALAIFYGLIFGLFILIVLALIANGVAWLVSLL